MTCNLSFGVRVNADKKFISKTRQTERILEVRVQAPRAHEQEKRPPLNLAIVLDRSGSMQGMKLEYVKKAASHVLDQLTEQDQVALVVYDDHIQVIANSMKVTHGNRVEMKRLISEITSGSMTNLGEGYLSGCREIAASARQETINRTLLLTDGLANVGITDEEVLAKHALELYNESISTSTFGVGNDFNEHLLEAMASRGGGNFYYIATPDRIPEIFLQEFNNLVGITARKVEVRLDLPPNVEWKVLGGWPAEYKEGRLHLSVGDMLTGKLQDIYIKLQVPGDDKTEELALNAKAFGQGKDSEVLEGQAMIGFQCTTQEEVEAALPDQELMQRFGEVELADEATEALKLERKGEREEAERWMRASIDRHRRHMSASQVHQYEDLSSSMAAGMSEEERKRAHWDSYNLKRRKENPEEK